MNYQGIWKEGVGFEASLRPDYSVTNGTIPDISRASTRSSSLFVAALMEKNGHNPIGHFTQELYIISE